MIIELKKIFVFVIVVCGSLGAYCQVVDIHFEDVSVHMDNSTSCFSGNFYDESGGGFAGNGAFYFRNELPVDIEIASGSDLSGLSLSMQGSANIFLAGDDVSLNMIELNLVNADLFLNGGFSLFEGLSLFSGKVLSETGGVVSILNTSESSIVFNNVSDNVSYVGISLKRNVVEGGVYSFPVGDAESYHPLLLTDLDADDQIGVVYSSLIDEDWKDTYGREDLIFPLSGGWIVEDEGFGSNYRLGLSRLDTNSEIIEGDMAVFHVTDVMNAMEYPSVDYDPLKTDPIYLVSSSFMGEGMYSLVGIDFDLKGDGDDIQFINTIVANSTSSTFFIIPELQKYDRIDIKVYDFLGELVFASKQYANDFNSINYSCGTYYYDMVIYLHDGSRVVKQDVIEVIREID